MLPFFGSVDGQTAALLIGALFLACAFEFVNGFHDTANAVATVIYTRTLKPIPAVLLSGVCNFAGVFLGGIAVAMAITKLLPVELLVQAGSTRGLAMVGALLCAAIFWNVGTWYLGLPASSSHTLIGSILGVGLANSWLDGQMGAGVNWSKAGDVALSLLVSPLFGFCMAALLLFSMRALAKNPILFSPPRADHPPPWWIRALLVGTCSGVSFAHGSNDGQKGVGLVLLILVGILPTHYALNLEATATEIETTRQTAQTLRGVLLQTPCDGPSKACVAAEQLQLMVDTLGGHARIDELPPEARWKVREASIRVDRALKGIEAELPPETIAKIEALRPGLATLTHYAPFWVVLMIALSLGVGTTVGWKRIVVTVGEKIGKSHLTYAQGAAAELVAMSTIGVSAFLGLPVSTTHVLSSGIAGTMVAEGSGLQRGTVRSIALAWLLTLPATMALASLLFVVFNWLAPK